MSTPRPQPTDDATQEENRRLRDRVAALEHRLACSETAPPWLSRLMDKAPIGLGVLDIDFRYLAVNRRLAEINGVSAEQHIGRTLDEVAPFVAAQSQQAFRRVVETRLPVPDQEVCRPAAAPGQRRYYSLTWFPVEGQDGDPPAVGMAVTEITERKRIEEAFRQREAALLETNHEIEALYRNAPAGMALVDAEFRYRRMNNLMAEIDGVTVSDTLGRTVAEVAPELWPQLEPLYRDLLERRQPVHNREVRGVTAAEPDVERYWSASYTPVAGADGRFTGVSCFVQDVTESRHAGEALKQSTLRAERRLAEIEAIYASAPVGLCVLDSQLRFARVNQRLAEINGVPAEAHIGKSVRDIVPDFALQVEAAWRKLIETGQPVLDFEMSGASAARPGEVRYWNNRWVPLKDEQGRVVGVSVAVEEITERRKAEEALRQSERLYRAIGESIDYGAWVCAPDGRTTYLSDSFLKLVGLTQEQCSNFGWRDALHPEDAERNLAAWKECVRTGGRWDLEHRFRGADGRYHTILSRGVPVRNEDGEVVCWAGINLDITRLKRAEERLREGQKLESIGLLAGGIAHDFNNLLVGMIGFASIAQDMLPQGHPVAELMKDVVQAGEQAAHLTRQMLAYAGKGLFSTAPLRLSDLVAETQRLVQTSLSKKISLKLDLAPDLPAIVADRDQIQQVFMNLVLNAAEAIGGDAGAISIRTGVQAIDELSPPQDLVIGDLSPGKYVYLEVRDTGCGMDPATQSRIFDPFFSTKFTGRGLGLAAVGGVVRSQKGAIKVETAPGAGSSFTVLFPLPEIAHLEAAAPAPPLPAPIEAPRPTATVLLVDDEKTVVKMTKKALERLGFKVVSAAGGPAAIDLFRTHPGEFMVVILDVGMPGMGGSDVLPQLRRIRPQVPIIVSSGYGEAETMPFFDGHSVAGFLQKPYTPKKLAELLTSALEQVNRRSDSTA